jgi:acetoacetate decarboxylase
MLIVTVRTDSKEVAAVLPRPLRSAGEPLAGAFVARYPKTNFGLTYNKGAVRCQEYRGERGWYRLSMPVDNDTAMIGGREQFGVPQEDGRPDHAGPGWPACRWQRRPQPGRIAVDRGRVH